MEFLRRKRVWLALIIILICLYLILTPKRLSRDTKLTLQTQNQTERALPSPRYSSHTSVEDALKKRRSVRTFKNQEISLGSVAQLLWAAQGITSYQGFRRARSAGARYPLEVYLVARKVKDLPAGVYHYLPSKHSLHKVKEKDLSVQLAKAALGAKAVQAAAANIVITALFSRTTQKYGEAGKAFVFMEAGHAAQNIYLQAVSLNLSTVAISSFDSNHVRQDLNISDDEVPLY